MSVLSLVPEDKRRDLRKESLASVYSSNSRLNLLNKRKRMTNPLTEMSNQSLNKGGDRYVTQRVLSAKTHRVKQLQNQLADAHYHLQELSNENRVLRAMQKKQEIALQRYENSNAELPQVLNSHSEEMRIQQARYKQLKQQFKEITQKLKEREMQLQQLKDEHQHLMELSKDRNLPDREKLQAQVTDLQLKVHQQNETITMLQRRLALEAKNFKHQLQMEMNKHKDTRHDLDLAINNADKLTTIIEMKERLLSNAATTSRVVKSPIKTSSVSNIPVQNKPVVKTKSEPDTARPKDDRFHDHMISKLCENSRNISSAMSRGSIDEDTSSSTEPRSRYGRSRTNSVSTRSTPSSAIRKRSKESDVSGSDMIELAKTVQDGIADLAIFDEDIGKSSPDELQKKMESMKADLMNKIKNNEEPKLSPFKTSSSSDESRRPSALRRMSTEESIEEQVEAEEIERPKSRGRRNSTVSFLENTVLDENITTVAVHEDNLEMKFKKETNAILERKLSAGKPIDKYCKDIIQDIEKSSQVIDRHMKKFNQNRFESDKLVQQLEAVDKLNDFVNSADIIPENTLQELNNNFKMLTEQVFTDNPPISRKRSISISSRKHSRESKTSVMGDANMTNQELLEDLLGKQ